MLSTRNWVRRLAIAAVIGIFSIYATAFGTAWLQEQGALDRPSSKVAAAISALGALTTSPWFQSLSGIVFGFAAGVWLDAYLARRAARRWWEGLHTFTIKSFSSLVAGVSEAGFETSARAKAVAAEILSYVNSGHMPLAMEMKRVPEQAVRLQDLYLEGMKAPYATKNVGPEAIVFKRDLEKLARPRNWNLPWPMPPKEKEAETPISAAPVPNSLGDLFPRALRSAAESDDRR